MPFGASPTLKQATGETVAVRMPLALHTFVSFFQHPRPKRELSDTVRYPYKTKSFALFAPSNQETSDDDIGYLE